MIARVILARNARAPIWRRASWPYLTHTIPRLVWFEKVCMPSRIWKRQKNVFLFSQVTWRNSCFRKTGISRNPSSPPLLPWEKIWELSKKNYQLTSWDGTLKFPRRLTSWDGTKKYIFSRDVWRAEMALWNSQVFVFALKMSCRFFEKNIIFDLVFLGQNQKFENEMPSRKSFFLMSK